MIEGPRAARPQELAAAIALANTVFGEERPHDMERWFPLLFREDNCDHLRLLLDSGKPVSLVAFTVSRVCAAGLPFTVACIGSVCTLKDYRGQGLASRLMDDCLTVCRRKGVHVLLISGGRGLYRRMGCIDAGLYTVVRVPRGARLPSFPVHARPWRQDDVPRLAALHGYEPVRFERGPDEFLSLLRTGMLYVHEGGTWVLESGGRLVAWMCQQLPVHGAEGTVASVMELGGSRVAILAAVPWLFEQSGADRIDLHVQDSDEEIRSLARLYDLPAVPRGFHGTVRVLDAEAALPLALGRARQVLAGPGEAALRIEADASGLAFSNRAERHTLRDFGDITALLFGSRERAAPLPRQGPLRSTLEMLFPIPLVDYGLNYV